MPEACEPVGVRIGADEGEQLAHVAAGVVAAGPVARGDRAAAALPRLRARPTSEPVTISTLREAADAVDQIVRHRLFERAADDQRHLLRVLGEVDHRLPGRIAAADQRDLAARAERRFERRGPVVDALALEFLEPRRRRAGGSARRRRPPAVRVCTLSPVLRSSCSGSSPHSSFTASSGIANSTPNFCAWL